MSRDVRIFEVRQDTLDKARTAYNRMRAALDMESDPLPDASLLSLALAKATDMWIGCAVEFERERERIRDNTERIPS